MVQANRIILSRGLRPIFVGLFFSELLTFSPIKHPIIVNNMCKTDKKPMRPHLKTVFKFNPIFIFPPCAYFLGVADGIREFEKDCAELAERENISFEQAKQRIIEHRKTNL